MRDNARQENNTMNEQKKKLEERTIPVKITDYGIMDLNTAKLELYENEQNYSVITRLGKTATAYDHEQQFCEFRSYERIYESKRAAQNYIRTFILKNYTAGNEEKKN
jgi:uncharacterized membrane protein